MSKRNGQAITRLPFHYFVAVGTSAGAGQVNMLPAAFPRVLEVADSFDMYRVSKFKFRIGPPNSTLAASTTAHQVAGFYPGVTDNAPASINDVSENIYSTVRWGNQTTPSDWVEVPKTVLQGYVPWYKTVAGSIDAALERFGSMFVFSSDASTTSVTIEYRGVFEFKGPANTGATPADRRKKMLLEEKVRMLKILALSEEKDKPCPSGSRSTPPSS